MRAAKLKELGGRKKGFVAAVLLAFYLVLSGGGRAEAMHIMEGFLPLSWAVFWWAVTLPFLAAGFYAIRKTVSVRPQAKMLLGLAGAFAFVLSALKIPSVTGSCSHPTGVGLGAVLFGPAAMSVLGCIVLLFQALLLAHGGISTLGANTFSMAVAGPFVAYAVYRCALKVRAPLWVGIFLAAFLGDLATYTVTSCQLALAFPDPSAGVTASFFKFSGIFALTQVPLALAEGLLTVLIFNYLLAYNGQQLEEMAVIPPGACAAKRG